MKIQKYQHGNRDQWNSFIAGSKNGTFLFHREYMEYHADRFVDHSLLIYDDSERLLAVMPASISDDTLNSHGGLTYGGVVTNAQMKASLMLQVFQSLRDYLVGEGIVRVVYKAVPHIFHRMPAEEDLYALYRSGAHLFRRDVSSAIYLPERPGYSENRRRGLKRALRNGLVVQETNRFQEFFSIVEKLLSERHNTRPVHSWEEMELLAGRFPENIRLFGAFQGDALLAGVVAYVMDTAIHTQYMGNSSTGMECGALDLVLDHLISDRFREKRYFSFGVSTEQNGMYLNEGLINQKEQFGAKAVVHDFYEMEIH